MITRVVLKNFKKIENEEFILSDFDLIVGANNSGKSTLLQALAIWQYCVDQFKRVNRGGSRGIQIVLPEFTALPLPEFVLLWKDKVERKNIKRDDGKTKPDFILIEIGVFWYENGQNHQLEKNLTIQLRYQSPLSIYAIPTDGFEKFRQIQESPNFPKIIYVPPFSGLEPVEKWQDDGNVRQNVGKGQPGSVLRNLLFRVIDKTDEHGHALLPAKNEAWLELRDKMLEWFGVEILAPKYEKGQSTQITVEYKVGKKEFDIISAGSGFHQILTLMAFYYGYYGVTTILFDEPDAHLHVNLQKKILSYFKQLKQVQFIIATHAEEFIKGVEVSSILSVLSGNPQRTQSNAEVIRAMSEVDNIDVVKTKQSPFVLYVEGEDDERLLTAWAELLKKTEAFGKFHIIKLGGVTKKAMLDKANEHFKALKQINPEIKRVVLFDHDTDDSFHPEPDNSAIKEWKRKNIENYLLVPNAWKRAILDLINEKESNLFSNSIEKVIDDFFSEESIALPKNYSWRNVSANIFQVVDGKKILFEKENSLFHRISQSSGLKINRDKVARNLLPEEIHEDIVHFFDHLETMVNS
jgi:predicted ATPase